MFDAIASDYDGTLAFDGNVSEEALAALERAKAAGLTLVLVTGRELDDLFRVFPEAPLFDAVVAENGALLYEPRPFPRERALGAAPPIELVKALEARGVPLGLGRIVIGTERAYERLVTETIADLDLQIIANKSSLMVLPKGVDKGSGVRAAFAALGVTAARAVGIGDAENDISLLDACGLRAAVANALPELKERAHFVLHSPNGAGFTELVARLQVLRGPHWIANDAARVPIRHPQ
jgi:hydroxymethylpyrimidine pyrophosphatase-like HAD family hydrolase